MGQRSHDDPPPSLGGLPFLKVESGDKTIYLKSDVWFIHFNWREYEGVTIDRAPEAFRLFDSGKTGKILSLMRKEILTAS